MLLDELKELKSDLLNTDINKIFEVQEKVADKSTEFYMRIPDARFKEQAIPPITEHSLQ